MQDRVLNHEQIEVIWNKTVEKINGDGSVSSIELKDVENESINEYKIKSTTLFQQQEAQFQVLEEKYEEKAIELKKKEEELNLMYLLIV